jgi:hypothetical protein
MLRTHCILTAAALSGALAACAPTAGPPPGRMPPPPLGPAQFSAGDFAWSKAPGRNTIAGKLLYRQGPTRFTCAGTSVILTPETPWSRRRMVILYKSAERSALPADEVRARTPDAPSGDSTPFIRRTTCDGADQFTYTGLPDGAWYVITVAKPATGSGESMALMRRVTTRGGKVTRVEF